MVGLEDTDGSEAGLRQYLDDWMDVNKILYLKRHEKQRSLIQQSILQVWFRWDVDLTIQGAIQNYALTAKNQPLSQAAILAFHDFSADFTRGELPGCMEGLDNLLDALTMKHGDVTPDLVHLTAGDIKWVHQNLLTIKRRNNGTLPVSNPDSLAARGVIRRIPFSRKPYRTDILLAGVTGVTAVLGPQYNSVEDSETGSQMNPPSDSKSNVHIPDVLQEELNTLKDQFHRFEAAFLSDGPQINVETITTIRDMLYAVFWAAESNFNNLHFFDRVQALRHELKIPGRQLDLHNGDDTTNRHTQTQVHVKLVGEN